MARGEEAHLNPIKAIRQWDKKTWRWHIVFWIGMAVLLTLPGGFSVGKFMVELLNMFFYAAFVYFNIFYLIPNYLASKSFGRFILLLIGTALVAMMTKVVVFYFVLSDAYANIVHFNSQALVFIAFFIVGGASTLGKIITDWSKLQRDKQALIKKTMTNELRFLRTQINPHFLFNTLNSLYALTLKKSDIAPEIVLKLSEMMRYMLYECNEKTVLLENEVNYIQNYLDLERLRHGERADIQLTITGDIKEQRIAPLFFIPFIENSFKHGLNHQIKESFVHIHLKVDDQIVRLQIENSKPEKMPLAPIKRSGGFGLSNVKQRLQLIYPNNHELSIKVGPKSYLVDMEIQLN